MRQSAKLILLAILILSGSGALAYFGAMCFCAYHAGAAGDDLAWLRHEFRLNESEMQRIRQLHEGYLPKCREMCARIAAKQKEVEAALGDHDGTNSAEQKLIELGTLRAECQAQMLRHFEEVSRAMPTEQGKRYLVEMQRLTLGLHEQIEKSMGASPHSGHGHGDR
jgi:hypothetical protein